MSAEMLDAPPQPSPDKDPGREIRDAGPSLGRIIYDALARNRTKIGGLFLALWSVAQSDQALITKHPRLNTYAAAAVAYIFAAGVHKSDSYHKAGQEERRAGSGPAK